MALWDDIDEPVLRWVSCLPPILDQDRTYDFAVHDALESQDVPGLRSDDVHNSLGRLRDYGLIKAECTEDNSGAKWYSLRVTADGLVVLGQWPDIDRVTSVTGLQFLLQQFADAADDNEERSALRRAMGAVGRLGGDIVKSTWASAASGASTQLTAGDPPPAPKGTEASS